MRHFTKAGASSSGGFEAFGALSMACVILSCVLAVAGGEAAGRRPFPQATQAPSAPENHAKVELIAEEATVRPGRTLWAGVLFRLDSGWHIYWQNPGDSGEPPKIRWELPPGFQAGATRWPRPIRLGSGSVIDYGYEGQALLMVPLRIPAALQSNAPATMGADVKYIVCREICIPGEAQLTLSVPATKDPSRHFSQWRQLFERTRAQWPKTAPRGWKISARSQGENFILRVRGEAPPRDAAFFPLDADVIENSAPQTLGPSGAGFQLTLRKSDQLIKPVAALQGLVVLNGTRAYEISAPIGPP
jgi:DsbC/DsbD-like thiol-disulfide interchange protein